MSCFFKSGFQKMLKKNKNRSKELRVGGDQENQQVSWVEEMQSNREVFCFYFPFEVNG